jgi:glucokinase
MTSKNKYALGVDIGGTNIKFGIISGTGKIIKKSITETHREGGPKIVVKQLIMGAKEILKDNKFKLKGIGIGAAGTVNSEKGTVENPPNMTGWEKVFLKKIISSEFKLKVNLDNDANAAAIGEMHFGAGKKLNSFVMVTLGTGVGGGIILNRKIYHGDTGAAGEIGHTVIDFNGPKCNCGSRGCIEAYVGNHYLVKRIQNEMKSKTDTKIWDLINHDIEKLNPRVIDEAAELGDEYAKSIIVQTGEYLGYAFASVANTLDITTFIIGGGVAGFGEPLINAAQKKASERVLTPLRKRIRVLPAKLKNDAGIQGASALVFYKN